ncbi:hypothetical protein UY3_10160 [Chelonia mydas]|uniref:Uncharacterized protein n=1 Tax=Chelonia mydas TaxID=8469 RepID=M7BAV3_CHEMY|nr:hypothetical protein UY3_10160 [Chelonia mydas]
MWKQAPESALARLEKSYPYSIDMHCLHGEITSGAALPGGNVSNTALKEGRPTLQDAAASQTEKTHDLQAQDTTEGGEITETPKWQVMEKWDAAASQTEKTHDLQAQDTTEGGEITETPKWQVMEKWSCAFSVGEGEEVKVIVPYVILSSRYWKDPCVRSRATCLQLPRWYMSGGSCLTPGHLYDAPEELVWHLTKEQSLLLAEPRDYNCAQLLCKKNKDDCDSWSGKEIFFLQKSQRK